MPISIKIHIFIYYGKNKIKLSRLRWDGIMKERQDVVSFILELHREKNFFNNIEDINKYNMQAIIEVIQYQNIKQYGDLLYTKKELRYGIKNYFNNNSMVNNDKNNEAIVY